MDIPLNRQNGQQAGFNGNLRQVATIVSRKDDGDMQGRKVHYEATWGLKKGAPAARRRASAAQMLSIPLPHTAAPPRVYGRSTSHGASLLVLLLKLCSRFGTVMNAHEKKKKIRIKWR